MNDLAAPPAAPTRFRCGASQRGGRAPRPDGAAGPCSGNEPGAAEVAGESVYRLETLSVPDAASIEDIDPYGAVQLFLERVRAQIPDFAVQPANRQAIVDICRRLDGLPLALELAAARVPVLGIEGLRQHLGERFRVLTGGTRMALRKHQTLRAALDWSHGLLTAEQRVVFRRLGVFAGGFTLELAQLVAADDQIDGWAVLDLLGHLVDKSLVVASGGEAGSVPRYSMLKTARAFSLEQLAASGEADTWLRRHAQVMRDYAETVTLRRWTLSLAAGLAATRALDNLRAAIDWARGEGGDRLLAIDLLAYSPIIWVRAGLTSEGRDHRPGQSRASADGRGPLRRGGRPAGQGHRPPGRGGLEAYRAQPMVHRALAEVLRPAPGDGLALAREAHRYQRRYCSSADSLFAAARHFANLGAFDRRGPDRRLLGRAAGGYRPQVHAGDAHLATPAEGGPGCKPAARAPRCAAGGGRTSVRRGCCGVRLRRARTSAGG
jgi:hypothetical protein